MVPHDYLFTHHPLSALTFFPTQFRFRVKHCILLGDTFNAFISSPFWFPRQATSRLNPVLHLFCAWSLGSSEWLEKTYTKLTGLSLPLWPQSCWKVPLFSLESLPFYFSKMTTWCLLSQPPMLLQSLENWWPSSRIRTSSSPHPHHQIHKPLWGLILTFPVALAGLSI